MAFSVFSTLLLSKQAIARSVMEKVIKTGVLTVGTSKDAFPFAYKDKNGRLTGYSIDMSILIHKRVEKELKRPIKLDLIPIDLVLFIWVGYCELSSSVCTHPIEI
jgi:polar amino acid transport system substrate-binding protein